MGFAHLGVGATPTQHSWQTTFTAHARTWAPSRVGHSPSHWPTNSPTARHRALKWLYQAIFCRIGWISKTVVRSCRTEGSNPSLSAFSAWLLMTLESRDQWR